MTSILTPARTTHNIHKIQFNLPITRHSSIVCPFTAVMSSSVLATAPPCFRPILYSTSNWIGLLYTATTTTHRCVRDCGTPRTNWCGRVFRHDNFRHSRAHLHTFSGQQRHAIGTHPARGSRFRRAAAWGVRFSREKNDFILCSHIRLVGHLSTRRLGRELMRLLKNFLDFAHR